MFILINIVWVTKLLVERGGLQFSERERELYEAVFSSFSVFDYSKVMRLASWVEIDQGVKLAEAKQQPEYFTFMYSGMADLIMKGGDTKVLPAGGFVGEISFLRGGAATADVVTREPSIVVRWPRKALLELLERNPGMIRPMQAAISADLLSKLVGHDSGQEGGDGWLLQGKKVREAHKKSLCRKTRSTDASKRKVPSRT